VTADPDPPGCRLPVRNERTQGVRRGGGAHAGGVLLLSRVRVRHMLVAQPGRVLLLSRDRG